MSGEPVHFGVFIITFNRPERLREVLAATLAQTRPPDRLLVVDNGDSTQTRTVVEQFGGAGVAYHNMGDNRGPAGAAAFALQALYDAGCDWIGFGDDDTPPKTPDTFARLLALADGSHPGKVGGVGAVGARFNWTTGQLERLPDEALQGVVDVDSIGSGLQLIVSREVVEVVGLPDARLFFGFYDPEYCLRVRRAGYRLLVPGDLMLTYREKAGRLNLDVRPSIVPVNTYNDMWRRYYVTRNYIFMMRTTFGRPDLARREALKATARSLFSWRRGPRYGLAFSRLQLGGMIDGYRGHLGRTVLPVAKRYGEPSPTIR